MKMKDKNKLVFVAIVGFLLFTASLLRANTEVFASYPRCFIPFWSEQRGGYETTLLNVNHIVRVVPVFDVEDIESDTNKIENAIHLEVHLSDGNTIHVEEDFKEFYTRMRKAN